MKNLSSGEKKYQTRVLLGVWGESFINHFLKFSLPSLLAPGNIPALVAECEVTFVFLTRLSDVHVFEASAAFQKLKTLCKIEFVSIKDLIVFGNYSTTLTYAYERAIQQTGNAMLNTYFIFLTSDYIMADGSMRGLLRYIRQGYSGIMAGNYQATQEDMEPYLLDHIDELSGVMSIPPRELVGYSLKHLHPVTVASMCDQSVVHNYRANRFFVKYNNELMAGRFYLLHMLCIKPETMDYRVGASCDYSFIPEMCPSGNVAIINDSDDYFVVEAQPRDHELNYISWGKLDQGKLVTALAEWTIERHRLNSKETIYYHTQDITDEQRARIEAKFSQFIDVINKRLSHFSAQPYYNHPYWLGAVKSFAGDKNILDTAGDYEYVNLLGMTVFSLPRRMYHRIFGVPPRVYLWHYRFGEYRQLMQQITQYLKKCEAKNPMILYDGYTPEFMRFRTWLTQKNLATHHYFLPAWQHNKNIVHEMRSKKIDACIIMERVERVGGLGNVLDAVSEILGDQVDVLLLVANEKRHLPNLAFDFLGECGSRINSLFNSRFKVSQVKMIYNTTSLLGALMLYRIHKHFTYSKRKRFLSYALLAIPGIIYTVVSNIIGKFITTGAHCTNVLVTLTPEHEQE